MTDQKNWLFNRDQTTFTDDLIEQLHKKTIQYGDFHFDDEVWYCNHKHKDARNKSPYKIYFNLPVRESYKKLLKYYALLSNKQIAPINVDVNQTVFFIRYLEDFYSHLKLKDVNKQILFNYEEFIKENVPQKSRARYYNSLNSFFKTMRGFPGIPEQIPTKRKNPFRNLHINNNHKYIPDEVARKFDAIMKDEAMDIPLELRTAYWLLRSFPNRGTEILSCPIHALKTSYSYYVLFVPTWKQNGGFLVAEIKAIPILNVGHGAYLIELIQRLEKQTENRIQEYDDILEEDKKFLFLSEWYGFDKENGKVMKKVYKQHENRFSRLTLDKFNRNLEELAHLFQIKDKKGNIAVITSHQFRHNAISDRIYIGGYSDEQVSELSKHKNMTMLASYKHPIKDAIKKLLTDNRVAEKQAAVAMKGKYFNLDENGLSAIKRINPNAYLTWEVGGSKGIGICGQIEKCQPQGTAYHFDCYACDWFIPKAEYLNQYNQELDYWHERMERYAKHPNMAASFENAARNAVLLERIIKICENGIDKYENELVNKIMNGDISNGDDKLV
ncbi:site-specific integrase [Cohnella abietis]|uniref:Tyr recombinase domain-containing protein n=1 Tax=Cohnella abietis TaxID=2507935 RepID=A0A3T1DA65_9BACL|nr:site-specific integrase [Cohnella abietis]BBI34963.1 hypothetical protein KCTCHS21_43620 [Cohnella abietis]